MVAFAIVTVALLGYIAGQAQPSTHPVDWGDIAARVGPLLVGLAGIFLAGYQVRLSDHDRADTRKAAFQQRLYDKQLEAFFELYVALEQLDNEALLRLTAELGNTHGKVPMTPERRWALRKELGPTWQQVALARQKWGLVIPSHVAREIGHFESVLVAVTAPPGWSSRSYPAELVNHVDPSGPVATAFTKVVRAIREAIGTDPLSEAMLKQIGAAAPPEDER
jgi:hypothetical protein